MQKQAADQAKQANAERNARLSYGKQNIQNIFEGTLSGAQPLDFSGITDANAPKATKTAMPAVMSQWLAQNPGTPAPDMNNYTKKQLTGGYSWGQLPDDGSGATQYGIFDKDGQLVNAGSVSELAATKMYAAGSGAGADTNPADAAKAKMNSAFGDEFYNKYRQSIMDYYTPQAQDQYNTARSKLGYALARAGQLDSSVATMDIADLAKQDAVNRAQIASGADTQTGALRTTIQQDEQSALNQLYSTEDPSVAANTAQNMIANANLTKPLLNPAGALFTPISVGVGNAISGFTNPTAYINPSSAATSSGSAGTGQNVTGY